MEDGGEGEYVTSREGAHDLPSSAASVGRARSIVRDAGTGLPAHVIEDAELLVSELMSNAVRHGGAGIRLTVAYRPGSLTVSVFDAGPDLPAMRAAVDPTVSSGRGLRMVAQLADDWGVDVDGAGVGKVVWFRLTAAPAAGQQEHREGHGPWS